MGIRHQTFLIIAFPQGKLGSRGGTKHANQPAGSNFPLCVALHFNVDGLMLRSGNRPHVEWPVVLYEFQAYRISDGHRA